MDDLISRQAAIDALRNRWLKTINFDGIGEDIAEECEICLRTVPSAQPEIIRCKNCRWWDKYGDYGKGYCMAAKHGYWSEHWDINIRRAYKGDFYCADAEPKGEQE